VFHITGGAVVAFWMVLMGIWVSRNLNNETQAAEIKDEKLSVAHVERDWMEIYLKDRKVGYAMNQINPLEAGYLIQEEIFFNLNLMGQSSVMQSLTRAVVDREFFLKKFLFRLTSGVVSFQISGEVDGRVMHIQTGEGKHREQSTIHLDGPVVIGAGMSQYFRGRELVPGQSFRFPLFDPSTMSRKSVEIKVVEKSSVEVNGITYPAFRLQMQLYGRGLSFWVNEKGVLLKEEGFMGLTLVKSSGAEATKGVSGGAGADFYELAAVKSDRRLTRPRDIRHLKVRLKSFHPSVLDGAAVDQGRQSLKGDVLDIVQEKLPTRGEYRLPYNDVSGKMASYLKPELTIQSDHPAILKKAGAISGGVNDPVAAARRLMGWVYTHVEKRPVVSVPDALTVLKNPVGDCNEHAVLLTALLRALKIPARVCVGLVYTNGRFYYHAWVEAYVGKWVSMDPTLNQMPADATHIQLVRGEMDKQVDLIALMGQLELDILDYAYDSPH